MEDDVRDLPNRDGNLSLLKTDGKKKSGFVTFLTGMETC